MRAALARLHNTYNPFGRTDSTSDLVERGIAVVFGSLRLGLAIQIALTVPFLLTEPEPTLAMAVLGAAVSLYCVAYVVAILRAEGVSRLWGGIDLTVGVSSLLICTALLPASVSSWTNWAPALLNQVAAFIPAWCRSIRNSMLIGTSLGVLYLGTFLVTGATDLLSMFENAISLPIFTLAAAAFGAYCRSMAQQADANRRQAIRLAAQLELSEYRFHLHNATGLLAQLARPNTPAELVPALRRQAGEESNRLRDQLRRSHLGALDPDDGANPNLGSVIWDATAAFGQLPLELPIALGQNATVTPKQGLALQAALIALLYNVQFHAQASEVTIHADQSDGSWEITVTDDGVGFDPQRAVLGFGLQNQVIDSLHRNGVEVQIRSEKGEGTCVTMTGPTATD